MRLRRLHRRLSYLTATSEFCAPESPKLQSPSRAFTVAMDVSVKAMVGAFFRQELPFRSKGPPKRPPICCGFMRSRLNANGSEKGKYDGFPPFVLAGMNGDEQGSGAVAGSQLAA